MLKQLRPVAPDIPQRLVKRVGDQQIVIARPEQFLASNNRDVFRPGEEEWTLKNWANRAY